MPVLRFTKLSENAFAPLKRSEEAAGFDLKSAYDLVIPKREKGIVSTDLKLIIPTGFYGRVAAHSGLAADSSIDVEAVVIDEDYRDPVKVILFNFSEKSFAIKKGDCVAQLICEKTEYFMLEEVKQLTETSCGEVVDAHSCPNYSYCQ